MTLSRAIDIIDKRDQCDERDKCTHCSIRDNDCCYECPMHVTGKQYNEAVHVVHKFAKGIKRRCETK